MRDSQRAKLYAADDVLAPHATPLPSVKDVERFTRKVWRSKRLADLYPRAFNLQPPRVHNGAGCRSALGGYWEIKIPLWARKTDVVIHELAHTICQRQYPGLDPGHGWRFCSIYLRVVLYFMGREQHDELKASFKAGGVRFRPPRKSAPLSPERRAALVAQLAAARQKT